MKPPPYVDRPVLEIDASLPADQRYAKIPQSAISQSQRLLQAILAEIPASVFKMAPAIRDRIAEDFEEELLVSAEMAGRPWEELAIANVSYDLAVINLGCSTMALATSSGPVLARNMDWTPDREVAQASYMYRYTHPTRGFLFANANCPGALGTVTGLSGSGFALALNAVMCPEPSNLAGYPVMLFLRKVLEGATSFDDALEQLCEAKLASPCLITLVGAGNTERVVIERTPSRFALRKASGNEPLFATNDYRQLFQPETHAESVIYQTTCDRYEAFRELTADFQGQREIFDNELLEILTHPRVIQDITAQHVIFRPRNGDARLLVPTRLLAD